jgi:hypothetical protein
VSKSSNKRYRRYRGNRKGGNRRHRDICPVCEKPISFPLTAIVHRESGKNAHFDCIVKELKKSHQLSPQEDIFYLGSGTFGIVEVGKGKKSSRFTVKKRIQYEEKK